MCTPNILSPCGQLLYMPLIMDHMGVDHGEEYYDDEVDEEEEEMYEDIDDKGDSLQNPHLVSVSAIIVGLLSDPDSCTKLGTSILQTSWKKFNIPCLSTTTSPVPVNSRPVLGSANILLREKKKKSNLWPRKEYIIEES